MNNRFEIIAEGTVDVSAGTWIGPQRGFTGNPTHTGAGDTTVTLDGGGVDITESVIICTQAQINVASSMATFGVVHTSDTAKQITSVQEQAGGAASIFADVDFHIVVVRINA